MFIIKEMFFLTKTNWSSLRLFFLGLFLFQISIGPVFAIDYSERTLVVSAYYSPLPGQIKYVTGSYAGDIRLNGNGTNGADGTEVYPGMLAAPKTYAFGTQVEIPGLGIGTVNDRGGAIKAFNDFDRIDVWMGSGDEGRIRAMNWGMRRINGKVYPPGSGLNNYIYFSNVLIPMEPVHTLTAGFGTGDKGPEITKIQEALVKIGKSDSSKVTGIYDEDTLNQIFEVQKKANIVSSWKDFGAGYFGAKTRDLLEKELAKITKPKTESIYKANNCGQKFCYDLIAGDSGKDVTNLQIELKKLGFYTNEATGQYDKDLTQAVLDFQISQGILSSNTDMGAGNFGPKTRTRLSQILESGGISVPIEILVVSSGGTGGNDFFIEDLAVNSSGGEVLRLQKFLAEGGYYDGEIGGLFSNSTLQGVLRFQLEQNLIASAEDENAGIFNLVTRKKANEIVLKQGLGTTILQEIAFEQIPLDVLVGRLTVDTLSPGEKNENVLILQNILTKLGFLENTQTSYYDNATKQALIDFQVYNKIISSKDSFGAGFFGKKTLEKMIEIASK